MKNVFSLLFKLLILTITALGIYLTLEDANHLLETLSYFTSFVNVMTGILYIFFLMQLVFKKVESNWIRFFKQTLIVFLALTTIVYSFVLIPYIVDFQIEYVIFSLKDIIIHYAVPLLVILDYAFFDSKGNLKPSYIGGNLFTLSAYVFYLFAYISLGGRFHLNGNETIYPYFFLDVQTLGVETFSWIAFSILGVVMILSWVVYIVDHILGVPLTDKKI
ncbi:MAG: Pr6Pr family membrane protein [Bacilli bacterium]